MIIKDFPNYDISPSGIVKNITTGKEIVKRVIRSYFYVDLKNRGRRKNARLGRLVATIFIPNPENKPQVNHIDGDRFNDNVKNLEWCTFSENQRHKIRLSKEKGTYKPPKGRMKIPKKTVDKVKTLRKLGYLHKNIAEKLGIGKSTVTHILLGSRRSLQ